MFGGRRDPNAPPQSHRQGGSPRYADFPDPVQQPTEPASETALSNDAAQPNRIRRTADPNVLFVNLSAEPVLPPHRNRGDDHYVGVEENLTPGGWVKLEIQGDTLFVNESPAMAFVDPRQKTDKPYGHELFWKFRDKRAKVLHPNILDAILEYPHFAPSCFLVDEAGKPRLTLFYGATFFSQDNGVGARGLYRGRDGSLGDICVWLLNGLDHRYPAALCDPGEDLNVALYYRV